MYISMATKLLNLQERIWIIQEYNKTRNAAEVQRQWKRNFREKIPARSTITRLVNKFEIIGSAADLPRLGRTSTVSTPRKKRAILDGVNRDPTLSLRRRALRHNVSPSTVRRIIKKRGFRPYRPTLVQALTDADKLARISFATWWAQTVIQYPELPYFIIWSDESTFRLDGTVNLHNAVYYATQNPNVTLEHHLHSPSVMVWAGMWSGGLIGPYFFEENVDGPSYLHMLETFLIPNLIGHLGLDQVYFQQDGAPAHFSLQVRHFLEATFPDRVIGRGCSIQWPPRSCDLTPMDFFLWGYIKDRVYKQKCHTLDQLRGRIRRAMRSISPDLCMRTCESVGRRLAECNALAGGQVD